LRVLYRLRDAGFQAFLVGGCVRDLLLGLDPKDFDVATDALPEQVKRLFRNCRLVGRRFRLAHVFFGQETIEVATFRATSAPPEGEEPLEGEEAGEEADGEEGEILDLGGPVTEPRAARAEAAHAPLGEIQEGDLDPDAVRMFDETGRILRDNVYGTIDNDVWRRDFTANALYYNVADFSIWDYVGGVEDIAARRLRLIGDPQTRYREDPVRMLRAARFEAKLGFELDAQTAEPLGTLRDLLGGVPPARLFDEMLKLFLTGHGARSLEVLRRRGLLAALLPNVEVYLAAHPGGLVEKLLHKGLANTDARIVAGRPVSPTFLLAVLLYGPIAGIIEAMPPNRWHELSAILDACDQAVREAQAHIAIPRRFALGVREMFAMQPRLEYPRGRRALRLLTHPKFRAGYDLLLLRADFGLASAETAGWWTKLQGASEQDREQMVDSLVPERAGAGRKSPRRRSGRRGRRTPNAS
jgi:poly(A) polymerase